MRAKTLPAALVVLFTLAAVPALAAPRWTQATPFGGEILAMAQAPSAPRLVYALSAQGQVFASRNGGEVWGRRGSLSVYPPRTVELFVAPREPETLYVLADGGLFRSRDGARHWEGINSAIFGVAVDREVPGLLYAASASGLYRSRDGGGSWDLAAFEDLAVTVVAADPRHPAAYFAVLLGAAPEAGSTIWKSSDRGETWTQISALDPQESLLEERFVFDPSRPDTLYLGGGFGPILRSSDSGVTWTGLPGTSSVRNLAVTPDGTLAAVTGRPGISRSLDRGATWAPPLEEESPSPAPVPADYFKQVAALSFPQGVLLAAGGEGVWTSTDSGASWRPSNQGLSAAVVSSLLIPPSGPPALFATAGNAVFRSADQGANWERVHTYYDAPSPSVVTEVDPRRPETLYGVETALQDLPIQSNDGGRTWQGLSFPYICDSASICSIEVRALLLDPGDPDTLYAAGGYFLHFGGHGPYLVRTTDGGATWEPLPPLARLQSLLVLPGRKAPLLAGTCNRLFKMDKTGGHWRRVGRGLPQLPCPVSGQTEKALAADPGNPRRIYAATAAQGVFVSDDGGETFRPMNRGLATGSIRTILVDPQDPSRLYVSAGQGYFQWNAGLGKWTPFNQGLPSPSGSGVFALDPRHPSRLYTATSQGIFRIDLEGEDPVE